MIVQKKRAQAQASSVLAIGTVGNINDALRIETWSQLLSAKPKRRVGCVLCDFLFALAAWIFFIGIIVYPLAQLVGLAVCAVALLLSPTERGSAIASWTKLS